MDFYSEYFSHFKPSEPSEAVSNKVLTPSMLPPLGLPYDLRFNAVVIATRNAMDVSIAFKLDTETKHTVNIAIGLTAYGLWQQWRQLPRFLAVHGWLQTTFGNGFVYHAERVTDSGTLDVWREYTERLGKRFIANTAIEFYA